MCRIKSLVLVEMNAEQIINRAINRGQTEGLSSLSSAERVVFLISEAEVHCDMDGIDSLLDQYPRETLADCARAFRAVGASDIADTSSAIVTAWPNRPDELLCQVNELITGRCRYDYEAIAQWIEGGN